MNYELIRKNYPEVFLIAVEKDYDIIDSVGAGIFGFLQF